jgi:chromosome partitioning protein
MVQTTKRLHAETMLALQKTYPDRFLTARIPFASDVERMGIDRAPVTATLPKSAAARAYGALCAEIVVQSGLNGRTKL